MNGNPWFELLVPYKYRRWRETEEAAAEPAPPVERQRHEWRIRSSSVRTAAGDAGRLEVCTNCGAERMVCVEEDGQRRVILNNVHPIYCGAVE
jgi:hypothetical protein